MWNLLKYFASVYFSVGIHLILHQSVYCIDICRAWVSWGGGWRKSTITRPCYLFNLTWCNLFSWNMLLCTPYTGTCNQSVILIICLLLFWKRWWLITKVILFICQCSFIPDNQFSFKSLIFNGLLLMTWWWLLAYLRYWDCSQVKRNLMNNGHSHNK